MEKQNMYPEMPPLPGNPDVPPSYDQTYPTAPSADMTPTAPSSGARPSMPMPMQPQPEPQIQQFIVQPQPYFVQNLSQIPPLGPRACFITCPSCHQQQMTNIRLESSNKTHLFALALCVLGLCCCVCIPYCTDTCKNANHYCSNCQAYLGSYSK